MDSGCLGYFSDHQSALVVRLDNGLKRHPEPKTVELPTLPYLLNSAYPIELISKGLSSALFLCYCHFPPLAKHYVAI